MDKKEIIREVARNSNYAKWEVSELFDSIIDVISTHIKGGGEVSINNFGRFKHRYYKPRKGCHPRTGKRIDIGDRAVVLFIPSPAIKVSDDVKEILSQR